MNRLILVVDREKATESDFVTEIHLGIKYCMHHTKGVSASVSVTSVGAEKVVSIGHPKKHVLLIGKRLLNSSSAGCPSYENTRHKANRFSFHNYYKTDASTQVVTLCSMD